jgi:hypothetical protein
MAGSFVSKHFVTPDVRFCPLFSNFCEHFVSKNQPADRLKSHSRCSGRKSFIEDFTGYKNRNGAIWSRGELKTFKNLKLADNAIGYTHASGNLGRSAFTSRVIDSLFVGETENIGNPRSDAEKAYGRSLPNANADYPIRGFEYYDSGLQPTGQHRWTLPDPTLGGFLR